MSKLIQNIINTFIKDKFNFLRLLFFMAIGYLLYLIPLCKTTDSGDNVKFRPPPITFMIVWPMLYLMFGISWIFTYVKYKKVWVDIIFAIVSTVITSWIVFYSCLSNKLAGVYVLLLSICLLLLLINIVKIKSRLLLIPLLSWLLFALLMNTTEVQNL